MAQRNDLILPTLHWNGTSRANLIEELANVHRALQEAETALRQAGPNGRDYYVTPGRYELALAQHTRRQKTIADLADEIEQQMNEIDALPGQGQK